VASSSGNADFSPALPASSLPLVVSAADALAGLSIEAVIALTDVPERKECLQPSGFLRSDFLWHSVAFEKRCPRHHRRSPESPRQLTMNQKVAEIESWTSTSILRCVGLNS
jgi:hypothetical protein